MSCPHCGTDQAHHREDRPDRGIRPGTGTGTGTGTAAGSAHCGTCGAP